MGLSMAQVQGYLMRYKANPRAAVENCHNLCDLKRSVSGETSAEDDLESNDGTELESKRDRNARKKANRKAAKKGEEVRWSEDDEGSDGNAVSGIWW